MNESLTNVCKNVNEFFKLKNDEKFYFVDDTPQHSPDFYYNAEKVVIHFRELAKLLNWTLKNIVDLIIKGGDHARLINQLLLLIYLRRNAPSDMRHKNGEENNIKWPFKLARILFIFLHKFINKQTWKQNKAEFYIARGRLFEIVRMLTFANEDFINGGSEESRFYLETLRQSCWSVRRVVYNLATSFFFNVPEETEKHREWLLTVFRYYVIEGRILDKKDIPKNDWEMAKTKSIVSRQEYSSKERMLAYYLGFVGDCVNSAFGIPMKNVLPRPNVGGHHEYLFDLCFYLLRNMSRHLQLRIDEYDIHNENIHKANWYKAIGLVYNLNIDEKTNNLASLLMTIIIVYMTIMTNFHVKTPLNEGQIKISRPLYFDKIYSHMTYIMIRLLGAENEDNSVITIDLKFDEVIRLSDMSSILNELAKLRRTCFNHMANFLINFCDIFVCKNEEVDKHKKWLIARLYPMMTIAQKLTTTEKSIHLSRIILPRKKAFSIEE